MKINSVKNTKLYDVIDSIMLSDKTYKQSENGQSSHVLLLSSTKYSKSDVIKAIEKLFDAKVESVRTLIRSVHSRSFRGVRSLFKQKIAYVKLKSGSLVVDS